MAAFPVLAHEMGAPQEAEVSGDCRAGNWKSLSNLSGGLTALTQQVQDSPACGIGQRLKSGLPRMCN